MNILVTGAAGFIGSHVCEYFIKLGHNIIGIDNFDNFYPAEFKKLNLAKIDQDKQFQFHKADIRDDTALNKIFSSQSVDVVIHLAAMVA